MSSAPSAVSHAVDVTTTTPPSASGTSTLPARGSRRSRRTTSHDHRADGRDRCQRPSVDLRARKIGDDPSDELEPGRSPPRECRETRRCTGRDGIDDRREEPEPEDERRCDERDDVRQDRVERRLAEVEQHDRSRHDAACERDRDRIRDDGRNGIAVESPSHARHRHEDRRDGHERQLESRLEK